MAELNLGKLRKEAVEARYGKMQMDPRDVIILIERIEKAERKVVELTEGDADKQLYDAHR